MGNLDKTYGFSWKSGDAITLDMSTAEPTPPPTEEPTPEQMCKPGCAKGKADWATKCGWDRCGACSECQGIELCMGWCTAHSDDWATKCSYDPCKGCGECASP